MMKMLQGHYVGSNNIFSTIFRHEAGSYGAQIDVETSWNIHTS